VDFTQSYVNLMATRHTGFVSKKSYGITREFHESVIRKFQIYFKMIMFFIYRSKIEIRVESLNYASLSLDEPPSHPHK
jgi:hypothetical protein